MRRALVACALLPLAAVVLAGCHDEERLRQRLDGPPARLPLEPDQPDTPPAPALLDTVLPFEPVPMYPAKVLATWQLAAAPVTDDYDVTYRVPQSWRLTAGNTRARNGENTIMSRATATDLEDTNISLATYAAQLADGNPISQYTTTDGHVVYVTRRIVALAPSDPETPREVFHTAVTSVHGRIAKLDVRYRIEQDWRFDQLAHAITGTVQVRPN